MVTPRGPGGELCPSSARWATATSSPCSVKQLGHVKQVYKAQRKDRFCSCTSIVALAVTGFGGAGGGV